MVVGFWLGGMRITSCSNYILACADYNHGFAAQAAPAADDDDDDDVDLFGSDDEEEDAEAEKLKQERVAAYAAKKGKKPALIAKSNIILDVSTR